MRAAAISDPEPQLILRPAEARDLDALVALENRVFATDRLSRRSFRHFLASTNAVMITGEISGTIAGYALVLFRPTSFIARLYSIAVAPEFTRRNVGKALLAAAEEAACARGCFTIRLEVHVKNKAAARLYEQAGYRVFGRRPDYYEDGGTALRFEKRLAPAPGSHVSPPPYFHQTTDFTCGPACMMMALAWAGRPVRAGAALEFKLWREATTIFMASGPGGCEPFGLAVTLKRYGLQPEIFVNRPGPYFLDGVRSPDRQRVMRLAQAEFRREAEELDIPAHQTPLGESALMQALSSGACAIVLVTGYRMLRRNVPHWVFAYGHSGRFVLIHDPAAEIEQSGHARPAHSLAIPTAAFARISRYGAENLRAAVVIRKGFTQ